MSSSIVNENSPGQVNHFIVLYVDETLYIRETTIGVNWPTGWGYFDYSTRRQAAYLWNLFVVLASYLKENEFMGKICREFTLFA